MEIWLLRSTRICLCQISLPKDKRQVMISAMTRRPSRQRPRLRKLTPCKKEKQGLFLKCQREEEEDLDLGEEGCFLLSTSMFREISLTFNIF